MNPIIINRDDAIVSEISPAQLIAAESSRPPPAPDPSNDMMSYGDLSSRTSWANIVLACQFGRTKTFAICKNNEHVAQVSLLRETYRLGESVSGVISFVGSRVPCYQVANYTL
jgi:hypothetical protein